MVLGEALIGAAVEAALSEVAAGTGKRLIGALSPSQRRDRTRTKALRNSFEELHFARRVSLLSLADRLPSGVSIARVERILCSLELKGVLYEMLAIQLAAASPGRRDIVRRNFQTVFAAGLEDVSASEAESLGGAAFIIIEDAVRAQIAEFEELNGQLLSQLRSLAATNLINATIEATGRHQEALAIATETSFVRSLNNWIADYRHQVIAEHGYIEPPDFERKRKVPIDELYVSPRIRPLESGDDRRTLGPTEFLELVDRTVLLGDPGAGKSTASNNIAFQNARDSEGRLPFVVVLREFARGDELDRSLTEYIEERCANLYQCRPPANAIEYLLLSGRALVIFDGLDELIDTSRRREVTRRVELFCSRYPLVASLVTSRRVGYEQAQMDPQTFETFVLADFSAADAAQYVEKWFRVVDGLNDDELEGVTSSFIDECQSVPDLTATPLMLALLCILYRGQGSIPKNRPAVYENCALLLFNRWDSSRRIFVELRAAPQVESAIKHLAYWMLTQQTHIEAVTERELIEEATEYLQESFGSEIEARDAAKEFVDYCRGRAWVLSDAGTTADGEALFRFTHRTFLEYFAAYELTRREDGPEAVARALIPRVSSGEWDVVGQLAVQISAKHSKRGGERIFERFLSDRRRRGASKQENLLTFLWRCLESTHISPTLVRRLSDASIELLFETRDDRRGDGVQIVPAIALAVRVLPELRTLCADSIAEKVVEMLGDSDLDRRSFAALFLVSWGNAPRLSGANRSARQFWKQWWEGEFSSRLGDLRAAVPDAPHVWSLAFQLGLLTVDDLAEIAFRDMQRVLSLFIIEPQSLFDSFSRPWSVRALHDLLRHSHAEPFPSDLATLRAFKVLGAMLDASTPAPWVESSSHVTLVRFLPRDHDWSCGASLLAEEDTRWAAWVLFACFLEARERYEFVFMARPSESSSSDEVGGNLEVAILQARKSREVALDLFAGSLFDSFGEARTTLRNLWASGGVNLLGDKTRPEDVQSLTEHLIRVEYSTATGEN